MRSALLNASFFCDTLQAWLSGNPYLILGNVMQHVNIDCVELCGRLINHLYTFLVKYWILLANLMIKLACPFRFTSLLTEIEESAHVSSD